MGFKGIPWNCSILFATRKKIPCVEPGEILNGTVGLVRLVWQGAVRGQIYLIPSKGSVTKFEGLRNSWMEYDLGRDGGHGWLL